MKVLPKNFPFYDWVPKPLGILFLLLLFIPIMTVSGVYSANSAETMGGLGIQSEHITFVGFATSVGMAVSAPENTQGWKRSSEASLPRRRRKSGY